MGAADVKDAQSDLDKLRVVLDLADDQDDDHRARQIGDLLAKVAKERADIPDAAEVKRRSAGGVGACQ